MQSTASQTGDGLVDFAFAHGRIVGKPAVRSAQVWDIEI
jgi:hypothetical protein